MPQQGPSPVERGHRRPTHDGTAHPVMNELLVGVAALNGDGGSIIEARDAVRVAGPDAARYLQGQLSQDVVAMVGASTWSFVLQPTGRVDAWMRVHRLADDDYVLEVEEGWGDVVNARMKRFLLRTKADIGDVERRWSVRRRWNGSLVRLGVDGDGALAAPAVAPGEAGVDLLFDDLAAAEREAADRVVDAAFERHRIAHGVPRMGRELTDATIPGEAGQWVIDCSVSFTKGCYTGQELVARIDSRGNTVPHPVRVVTCQDADLSVGDELDAGEDRVAIVTSAVPRVADLPSLALAIVPRAAGDSLHTLEGAAVRVVEPGSIS